MYFEWTEMNSLPELIKGNYVFWMDRDDQPAWVIKGNYVFWMDRDDQPAWADNG